MVLLLLNIAPRCSFSTREKSRHTFSGSIIALQLPRNSKEPPQRKAKALAHFHSNRRGSGEAKGGSKATGCRKLSSPARGCHAVHGVGTQTGADVPQHRAAATAFLSFAICQGAAVPKWKKSQKVVETFLVLKTLCFHCKRIKLPMRFLVPFKVSLFSITKYQAFCCAVRTGFGNILMQELKKKKKSKLACYDLLHCLSVSMRNANVLPFLPLFGTDPTFLFLGTSLLTLLQLELMTEAA